MSIPQLLGEGNKGEDNKGQPSAVSPSRPMPALPDSPIKHLSPATALHGEGTLKPVIASPEKGVKSDVDANKATSVVTSSRTKKKPMTLFDVNETASAVTDYPQECLFTPPRKPRSKRTPPRMPRRTKASHDDVMSRLLTNFKF